jgi:hypothetical protein
MLSGPPSVTGQEKQRQLDGETMTTLRIEHAIHDFETWQKAFDGFAEARTRAGVRSLAIRRPVDDPKYLLLDLEFDTAGQAEAFAEFLRRRVWSAPASSPGLAGTPQTRILDLVNA